MKESIAIIYGGKSAEHEVSLLTAKSIINAINKNKYRVFPIFISNKGEWARGEEIVKDIKNENQLIYSDYNKNISELLYINDKKMDLVFPVLHGPNGEDGTIQGLLEIMNIPYVGNKVLSSAAGMDKSIMKELFSIAKLPQLPYYDFLNNEWINNKGNIITVLQKRIGFPMFIKPANMGSSVGITKAHNDIELIEGINLAFKYDRKVVVEKGLSTIKEIEVAVLGTAKNSDATYPGEIINISSTEFYDYKTKYTNGKSKMEIPANIDNSLYEKFMDMAKIAFDSIDANGLARVDFFLTEKNEIYINEINTMPGFTPFSMYPLLWKNMGLSYSNLIEKLIKLAKITFDEKNNLL